MGDVVEFLISILAFIGILYLVVRFSGGKKKPPDQQETIVQPNIGEVTERLFAWNLIGISLNLYLENSISIRNDALNSSRISLMNSTPSKTVMFSSVDCFEIAREQILHDDFGISSQEIAQVARYLQGIADSEVLSDIEFASLILSFTQEQCIPYQLDIDSTGYPEYFRFPIETLYDQTGDCDCKSILATTLFKLLGFRVAFAILPGHAALAVCLKERDMGICNFTYKGVNWYYCETTGDFWTPGQIPDSVSQEWLEVQEI